MLHIAQDSPVDQTSKTLQGKQQQEQDIENRNKTCKADKTSIIHLLWDKSILYKHAKYIGISNDRKENKCKNRNGTFIVSRMPCTINYKHVTFGFINYLLQYRLISLFISQKWRRLATCLDFFFTFCNYLKKKWR